jgi:hypothetical protein
MQAECQIAPLGDFSGQLKACFLLPERWHLNNLVEVAGEAVVTVGHVWARRAISSHGYTK